MNVDIQSNLFNLNQELVKLKENDDVNSSSTKLKVIASQIEENLAKIKSQSAGQKLTFSVKTALLNSLDSLNQGLDNYNEVDKIKQIREQVLSVKRMVASTPLQDSQSIMKPKIGLKMGFICDFDLPDHNGAMAKNLVMFLKQNQPFISTRSVLQASDVRDTNVMIDLRMVMQNYLISGGWEIYQLNDSQEGNGLLVFLPPTSVDKPINERLKEMDLKSDGTLKKISFSEALESEKGKPSIEGFMKLFVKNPSLNKLFYLSGHGSNHAVGGLNEKHYIKLMKYLDDQHCRGLMVNSCSSGGKSSLLTLAASKEPKGTLGVEEEMQHRTFPTIVRSIGDFPTLTEEVNVPHYFNALSSFLESSQSQTPETIRKTFEKLDGSKPSVNRSKVFFPSSLDSPSGFRPLEEAGLGYSLTYTKLKGSEIESKLFEKEGDRCPLVVKNHPYLDVHPLVVNQPVKFEQQDSVLLSMVPGNSHHFLKSLELSTTTPDEFLLQTMKFHSENSLGASKAFFVGSLKSKSQSYDEVMLMMTPRRAFYTYREAGQYYYSDGNAKQKLTPVQHAILTKEVELLSVPSKEAVRASSGGQESEEQFSEALYSQSLGFSEERTKFIFELKDWLKKPEIEFLSFVQNSPFSATEKQDLCFLLLDYGRPDLVITILEKNNLDLNCKNYEGELLFIKAIIKKASNGGEKSSQLTEFLLRNNVELNIQNSWGNTPLHIAVTAGDESLVKAILAVPNVKINVPNKSGLTAVAYSLDVEKKDLFTLLKTKGAKLDYIIPESNNRGLTLLGVYAAVGDAASVDLLLEADADPNRGSPSPLTQAIRHNNYNLVEKMLEKGGKPFQQDSSGAVPYIEAIFRCSPEFLARLASRPDFLSEIEDKNGLTPLIASLFTGDQKKVDILLEKKVSFPNIIPKMSNRMLSIYFGIQILLGNEEILSQLSKISQPESVKLLYVIQLLKNQKLDLLSRLIGSNKIDIKLVKVSNLLAIIKNPGEQSFLDFLDLCLQKGMNPNELFPLGLKDAGLMKMLLNKGLNPNTLEDPLDQAALLPDPAVFKILVEGGGDLNKLNAMGSLPLFSLIERGDIETIKFCFDHGAKLETPIQREVALQQAFLSHKPEVVDLMLAKGFSLSEKGISDLLPLLLEDIPMMRKFMETNTDLAFFEEDQRQEIWKSVLTQETPQAEILSVLLMKNGVSPIVNGKNVFNKFAKKFDKQELIDKLTPYMVIFFT